jgi:phosphatidate cytidylyltransferase
MLTRIITGVTLTVVVLGLLTLDYFTYPWSLGLLALCLGALCMAAWELAHLLPNDNKPHPVTAVLCVAALVACCWLPVLPGLEWMEHQRALTLLTTFIGLVVILFLVAMRFYHGPAGVVARLAAVVFIMAYLGLLPASLITLRWAGHDNPALGLACILVTIFTTKCCDIGAYFTGRFFGRHRMTPVLSPKKTWEGLSGGLAFSTLVSLLLWRLAAGLTGLEFNPLWAAGFGLTVGLAGALGDLAESMIKRDLGIKDAANWLPGFGGMLDLIDAVLFAAPVAWLWLAPRFAHFSW